MPSHKVHGYVDRQLCGRTYWKLHRRIDMPYLFMGRKHRVLFHDGFSSVLIAQQLYPGDRWAEEAALTHCQIDEMCSSDPVLKKQLEMLADSDVRQRRKSRTLKGSRSKKTQCSRKPKQANPLRNFEDFLTKIEKVKRLSQMLRS